MHRSEEINKYKRWKINIPITTESAKTQDFIDKSTDT